MSVQAVLHIVGAKVWGGGEQYVCDVCRETRKRGTEVFVAVDSRQKHIAARFRETASIVPVQYRGFTGINTLGKLRETILRNNISVIHNHSGHFAFLARMLQSVTNTKLLLYRHNSLPPKRDLYHRWLHRKVFRIICVSQLVYNTQTAGLSDAEKKRYALVYNGIPADRFDTGIEHKKFGKPFTIGFAGRVYPDKGIEPLLQAFALFRQQRPDSILKIAGPFDKGYGETFYQRLAEYGLEQSVEYSGLCRDMERFYKSVDILAVPSLFREPFGLVVGEAALCGTPVIASNNGGPAEIITSGENGLLVPPGDVPAWNEAFDSLARNEQFWKRLSEKGRKNILDHFTIERCVDGLFQIYESAE